MDRRVAQVLPQTTNKVKTTIIRSLENTRMTTKQPVFTCKGDTNTITNCNNQKKTYT